MATVGEKSGVDVRTAVRIAKQHVNDLFQVSGDDGARLEEVELSDDLHEWLVTVSIVREERASELPVLYEALAPKATKKPRLVRELKRVVVSAQDGIVKGVTIRTL